MTNVGTHCLIELHGCPPDLLDDPIFISRIIAEAVDRSGATLLDAIRHQFTPQGVTALALLAESHISIHTWPETGYAAVDLFTCGDQADPLIACQHIVDAFRPVRCAGHKVERGNLAPRMTPLDILTPETTAI